MSRRRRPDERPRGRTDRHLPGGRSRPGRGGRLFLIAVVAGIAAGLGATVRGCVEVDRCLDAGGRWDEATGSCDGARPGG